MINIRNEVIQAINQEKLIAIVRGVKEKHLIPLAHALYKGGIKLMEITYCANGEESDENIAKSISLLSKEFKDKMFIGAGTVLTEKQVELTKQAGGLFIISPDTNEKVIKKTRQLNLVSIPGALTPTEVQNAHRYGGDFIKLFPITNMGVEYYKSIKAPLSHVKMLAVGGINLNNIGEYLSSGICGFGLGSNIVDKTLIEKGDFEGITNLAKKYVQVVKN